jgi:hypothetical protein
MDPSMKRPTLFGFIITATVMASTLFVMDKCHANTADLSWVHPTQFVDGTTLALSQIARTEVQYGVCNGTKSGFLATPAPVTINVLPPPALAKVSNLAPGIWCFRARTVATTSTTPSDWTGYVWKEILPPAPKPPTNLLVSSTVAYSVVKRVDRFAMVAVGTVPAGTSCIPDQTVNGYYVVPRASVQWTGSVKPDVVVATCQ